MSKNPVTVAAFLERETLVIGLSPDPRTVPVVERFPRKESAAGREEFPDETLPDFMSRLRKRGARTIAVALPTTEVLPRILRLPPADPDEMRAIVELQMSRIAPFAGEEMACGHEVLSRDDKEYTVLGVAAPVKALDPLADCAASARIRIGRIDLLGMGLWAQLKADGQIADNGRVLVLAWLTDGWDLIVCDDGIPALIRHLPADRDTADLKRDLSLSILQLQMDSGGPEIVQVLLLAADSDQIARASEALSKTAGVEPRTSSTDDPLTLAMHGMLKRLDHEAIDLVPESWRHRAAANRSRKRLILGLGAGILLWILLNAALFLAPGVLASRLDSVRRQTAAIAPAFEQVSDLRDRIRMIHRYTDRSTSLLACLREISSMLPEGVTLTQFTYRRDEDMVISGEAFAPSLVYALKEQIDASPVFSGSRLTGPRLDQGRKMHLFELQIYFREGSQ